MPRVRWLRRPRSFRVTGQAAIGSDYRLNRKRRVCKAFFGSSVQGSLTPSMHLQPGSLRNDTAQRLPVDAAREQGLQLRIGEVAPLAGL